MHDLEAAGLLVKTENHVHTIGRCYRCGTVIEPYLSDQWFVKMKPLAGPALQAVLDGRIRFHPGRWVKTYENWLTNIRDWCISRQLWWGHRIPVWYCEGDEACKLECKEPIVSRTVWLALSLRGAGDLRPPRLVLVREPEQLRVEHAHQPLAFRAQLVELPEGDRRFRR